MIRAVRLSIPVVVMLAVALQGFAASADDDWSLKKDPSKNAIKAYKTILSQMPTDDYAFGKLVAIYAQQGNMDALVQSYEGAKSTGQKIILGRLYTQVERYEDAEAIFEGILADKPSYVEVALYLGDVYKKQKLYDKAIETIDKGLDATKSKAKKTKVLKQLYEMSLMNKDIDGATGYYEKLKALDPKNIYLRLDFIAVLTKFQHLDIALTELESAKGLIKYDKPKLLYIDTEIGSIYEKQGKYDAALENYDSCLERIGKDHWARRELLQKVANIYRLQNKLPDFLKKLVKSKSKGYEELFLTAKLYEELGKDDKALEFYKKAVKKRPLSLEAHENLINILKRVGTFNEIAGEYRSLIKLFPGDHTYSIKLARHYFNYGKTKDGFGILKKLSKKFPNDPGVHSEIIQLYIRYNADPDKVVTEYKKLMKLEPKEASHVVNLGEYYFTRHDFSMAYATWKKLLDIVDPEDEASFQLAELYAEHEQLILAEPYFKKAIELAPEKLDYLKPYALFLENYGQPEEGMATLETLVAKARKGGKPDIAREGRLDLLKMYDRQGMLADKLEALYTTWKKGPQTLDESLLLAEGSIMDKQYDKAEEVLLALKANSPDERDPFLYLEELYSRQNKLAQAVAIMEELVQKEKNDALKATYYQKMAKHDLSLDDTPKALEHAKAAIELFPADAGYRIFLGDILRKSGDSEAAVQEYQKAVALGESDSSVLFEVAAFYDLIGEHKKQQAILEKITTTSNDINDIMKAGAMLVSLHRLAGSLDYLEEYFLGLYYSRSESKTFRKLLVELYLLRVTEIAYTLDVTQDEKEAVYAKIRSKAMKPLLDSLNDDDIAVKLDAILVLRYLKPPQAILPLVQLMAESDEVAKFRAVVALGAIGSAGALSVFENILGSSSQELEAAVIWGLGKIHDTKSLKLLMDAYNGSPSTSVQRLVCLAVGALGMPKGIEILKLGLESPDEGVRAAAALAMGRIGNPDAIPLLVGRLPYETEPVAEAIAWSLAAMKSPAAVEPLLGLMWAESGSRESLYTKALLLATSEDTTIDASPLDMFYESLVDDMESRIELDAKPVPSSMIQIDVTEDRILALLATHGAAVAEAVKAVLHKKDRPSLTRILTALNHEPSSPLLTLHPLWGTPSPKIHAALVELLAPAAKVLEGHLDEKSSIAGTALVTLAKMGAVDVMPTITSFMGSKDDVLFGKALEAAAIVGDKAHLAVLSDWYASAGATASEHRLVLFVRAVAMSEAASLAPPVEAIAKGAEGTIVLSESIAAIFAVASPLPCQLLLDTITSNTQSPLAPTILEGILGSSDTSCKASLAQAKESFPLDLQLAASPTVAP